MSLQNVDNSPLNNILRSHFDSFSFKLQQSSNTRRRVRSDAFKYFIKVLSRFFQIKNSDWKVDMTAHFIMWSRILHSQILLITKLIIRRHGTMLIEFAD